MPVGWTDCPEGFALDGDDDVGRRGCRAIIPPRACSGAARDALGGACLPVGDCAAAFPPREATHFVDDSYGPEELDETHFDDIVPALQAAPAGAVIAIESGVYSAIVQLAEPVTLVGRCAGEVTLVGDDEHLGFLVSGVDDVVLRGLTLGHFVGAVAVDEGGSVRVEDSVFEGNGVAAVIASGAGSRVSLSRSVVRDTAAIPAARNPGAGVLAQDGGRVEITESALVGNALSNLTVFEAGSEARVERSVLRDGVLQPTGAFTGDGGYGLYVYRGGRADVLETAIRGSATAGIQVMRASQSSPEVVSHLDVQRSDITGVTDNAIGGVGRAVTFLEGATGAVSSSTLGDGSDGVVLVATGASATLSGSTLVGAVTVEPVSGHGVFVDGGTLDVQGTVVTRHRWAAFGVAGGGLLTVRESLVVDPIAGQGKPDQGGAVGAYAVGGARRARATRWSSPSAWVCSRRLWHHPARHRGAGLRRAAQRGRVLRPRRRRAGRRRPGDRSQRARRPARGGGPDRRRRRLAAPHTIDDRADRPGHQRHHGARNRRLRGRAPAPRGHDRAPRGHGMCSLPPGLSQRQLHQGNSSACGAAARCARADAPPRPGLVTVGHLFRGNGSRVGSGVIALPAPVGQ